MFVQQMARVVLLQTCSLCACYGMLNVWECVCMSGVTWPSTSLLLSAEKKQKNTPSLSAFGHMYMILSFVKTVISLKFLFNDYWTRLDKTEFKHSSLMSCAVPSDTCCSMWPLVHVVIMLVCVRERCLCECVCARVCVRASVWVYTSFALNSEAIIYVCTAAAAAPDCCCCCMYWKKKFCNCIHARLCQHSYL